MLFRLFGNHSNYFDLIDAMILDSRTSDCPRLCLHDVKEKFFLRTETMTSPLKSIEVKFDCICFTI